LVSHLNWLENKHDEHRFCLDQIDRPQPQPECLYVDGQDGTELVIERKSISWPESYPYEHSKDHVLAKEIYGGIAGIEFPDVYSLAMPVTGECSAADLREMGRFVAAQIRARYVDLESQKSMRIECNGRRFVFKIRPMEDRDNSEPSSGVVLTWAMSLPMFDNDDMSARLRGQIQRIYAACVRKFAGYSRARRILMLDPHGDVAFTSARAWNEFFALDPPPEAIQEIWIGSHGVDDCGEDDWVIQKAYGDNLTFPCLPTIPASD
jgi:hypothetical protein